MKILIPGSFDPPTNGHIDVIKRCSKIFTEILVGVVVNPSKESLFSREARSSMLEAIFKDYKNIKVMSFEGLLVDFASKNFIYEFMATKKVTDESFEADVIKSQKPTIVDFWAEWCGPCRMIAPMIEELASDYEGKATIGKLDVDNNQESSVKFGVRSIPTLLIFKDGELIDRHVGAVGKETLSKSIDSNLS